MHITSIGVDLGKTTFHLVALGERNKVLVRKKFSRAQLLAYTANLPASLIGLEACAGAHFLGAALREQGHQVRLIPAQFVKPYRGLARRSSCSKPGRTAGLQRQR
jgi:transposase